MHCARRPGVLLSVDNYYNLQLADTEEWIDGAMAGNLGEVLIRCVQNTTDSYRSSCVVCLSLQRGDRLGSACESMSSHGYENKQVQ